MNEISNGELVVVDGMPIPYRRGIELYEDPKTLNTRIHGLHGQNTLGTKCLANLTTDVRVYIAYLGAVTDYGDEGPELPEDIASHLMTLNSPADEERIRKREAPIPTVAYPFCDFPEGGESYYGIYVTVPASLVETEKVEMTVGGIYDFDIGSKDKRDTKRGMARSCVGAYKKKYEEENGRSHSGKYNVKMETIRMPVVGARVDGGYPLLVSKHGSIKEEIVSGFRRKSDDQIEALLYKIAIKDAGGSTGPSDRQGFLSYVPHDFKEWQEATLGNPYTGMVEVEVKEAYYIKNAEVKPVEEFKLQDIEDNGFGGLTKSMGGPKSFGGSFGGRSAGRSAVQHLKTEEVKVKGIHPTGERYFGGRIMLVNPFNISNEDGAVAEILQKQ